MDVITHNTQSFSLTIVTCCFCKAPWKPFSFYFPFTPWRWYHRFIEIIHPRSLLVSFEETPLKVKAALSPDLNTVRVMLCVSSVPASCVHIWFVSCPCFMSLWVNLCPAVCMWLCVNYPVYLVPVFWVWFRLVYSLLPGVSCLSALSCPALMSWLNTVIWVYVLICVSLFLPRVCTVTNTVRWFAKMDLSASVKKQ